MSGKTTTKDPRCLFCDAVMDESRGKLGKPDCVVQTCPNGHVEIHRCLGKADLDEDEIYIKFDTLENDLSIGGKGSFDDRKTIVYIDAHRFIEQK